MTRVLAYDSGAERMGWAVLEGDGETAPTYINSGIERFARGKKAFQLYKLNLIEHWTVVAPAQFVYYKPDAIVCETLPAVGGGSFVAATQSELAKASITTVMAMAYERDYPVYQLAAVTVKKQIGGKPNASKVQVRNGAIGLLPVLEPRKFEWTDAKKTMDEPDAIGVGLTHLGYSTLRLSW
jgi:Holliday junction resolvasome RuvABC endonuclease subunit